MADALDVLLAQYGEHASQARQHENQRQLMTAACLTVAGLFFSQKHYERNRLHTEIMAIVRAEIDQELVRARAPGLGPPTWTTATLRAAGEANHYSHFPRPTAAAQAAAKSWIARQRLQPFWSTVHVFIVAAGVLLTAAIAWQAVHPVPDKPLKVEIENAPNKALQPTAP